MTKFTTFLKMFILSGYLMLGFSEFAVGQTAAPVPSRDPATGRLIITPGGPANTRLKKAPTLTMTRSTSATFTRTDIHCLRAGGIVRIVGRGFLVSPRSKLELFIKSGNTAVSVPVLSARDQLITSRLTSAIVLENEKRYRFELRLDGRVVPGNGNKALLSVCPLPQTQEAEILKIHPKETIDREFLAYLPFASFSSLQIDDVRANIVSLGLSIQEEISLESLEAHLFRVKAEGEEGLAGILQGLQLTFPAAVLDFNHVSQLASDKRYYAGEMMGLSAPPSICKKLENIAVRVGVIDGGPNMRHPALATADHITLVRFGDGPSPSPIASQHGTAITAQYKGIGGASGLYGILPESHLLVADVLSTETGLGNSLSLLKSFNWLIRRKSEIISISMEGPANRLIENALRKIDRLGIFVVAAAGNGGLKDVQVYPAAYPTVISVTAVGPNKAVYVNANSGRFVDFAAPGVSLWLAKKDGGASYRSGTSFAVPFVVAKIAELISRTNAVKNLSSSDLKQLVIKEVQDIGPIGRDNIFGSGLVSFSDC
ncbi:MAG: S8 family serine peptidase [Sneathiella sp.]